MLPLQGLGLQRYSVQIATKHSFRCYWLSVQLLAEAVLTCVMIFLFSRGIEKTCLGYVYQSLLACVGCSREPERCFLLRRPNLLNRPYTTVYH